MSISDVRQSKSRGKRAGQEQEQGLREPLLSLPHPRGHESRVLGDGSHSMLRGLLPPASRALPLCSVFCTHRHGWSLQTLYRTTLGLSPCVLLLRSLQQGIVLGAYLSGEFQQSRSSLNAIMRKFPL